MWQIKRDISVYRKYNYRAKDSESSCLGGDQEINTVQAIKTSKNTNLIDYKDHCFLHIL